MPSGQAFNLHRVFYAGLIVSSFLSMPMAAWTQKVYAQKPPAQMPPAKDPPVGSLSAEQVKAKIERLGREIETQRNSPQAPADWKELLRSEERLANARATAQKEIDAIRREVETRANRPDAVRWRDGITQMERRLEELHVEDWELTKNAGRRLFQARHAELAKLANSDTPRLRSLGLDVLNYPRMDGSTSCQPLAALIACRCFGAPYAWVGKAERLPKDRSDIEYSEIIEYFRRGEPELELLEFTLRARDDGAAEHRLAVIINRLLAQNASTHEAYVNLIEGKSEIGLLARAPSPDELKLAKMQNVELDAIPCALDAFVFLVNTENTIRNLKTSQIRDIYAGKIKNWNQVGGAKAEITPYQREENSGSQQLMRDLVMKDVAFEKTKEGEAWRRHLIDSLMSSVFLKLTRDTGGLAYSVHYYERFMSGSPRTRTIAVDGVEPTFDTIRDRKYPHTTEVFVVTRKAIGPGHPAAKLRDWLLSPEGQSVVRESGYVPLPIGK